MVLSISVIFPISFPLPYQFQASINIQKPPQTYPSPRPTHQHYHNDLPSKRLPRLGRPRLFKSSYIHNIHPQAIHPDRHRNSHHALRNLRYRRPHPPLRLGANRLPLRRRSRNNRLRRAHWLVRPYTSLFTSIPVHQSRRPRRDRRAEHVLSQGRL